MRDFDPFAPTAPRFGFDAYCKVQLLLVHDPIASGVVLWVGQYPEGPVEVNSAQSFPLLPDLTCAASGALAVDAGLLFADVRHRTRSTPLKQTWRTLWLDLTQQTFRNNWVSLADMFAAPVTEEIPTVDQPPLSLATPAPSPAAQKPELVPARPVSIATPYAAVLADLKRIGPWNSWKRLATLLGTSHTQLRRIANGEVSLPSNELAPRIDELHRFAERIARLSSGHETVTKRLLTTPRERDGWSANDFLERRDYRNAFRAVMEAASPRPHLAAFEDVPRRWYDEPSRDLYDNGVEREE